jgi:hypothetical protein
MGLALFLLVWAACSLVATAAWGVWRHRAKAEREARLRALDAAWERHTNRERAA